MSTNVMINTISDYFKTQPVLKAWLFGSFSRGEETADSDVDILVEFDRTGKPVTLLTYARIWRELEERLGRDVDLVENGTLKPYAIESANHDKRLIYEREN
ncbi:MAG: nucleotidyltransferase family protein [Ruminococcus sp.]